jgi:hypothetical protein
LVKEFFYSIVPTSLPSKFLISNISANLKLYVEKLKGGKLLPRGSFVMKKSCQTVRQSGSQALVACTVLFTLIYSYQRYSAFPQLEYLVKKVKSRYSGMTGCQMKSL